MRRVLVPILLAGLNCYAQIQAAGAPPNSPPKGQASTANAKAEISGQVLDAATGQPLKKTWVTARVLEKGGRSGSTAVTDAEGHFLLKDLDAGRYILMAQRNGYVPQTYGQKNAGEQGTTLSLNSGQTLTDIIFRLMQGGVISGRIVDEDSEPLSRVQVQVLQFRYMQGRRRLVPMGSATSDDRGEYRIFGVRPGQVYVRATLRGLGMYAGRGDVVDSSAPSETTSYPPVFYPNVTDASQALPLTVRGGDELHADLSLSPQRSYSVSGRLVGGAQGAPEGGVWLMLAKRGQNEFAFGPGLNTGVREDNTFTFKHVLPGSYNLIAQRQDENPSASAVIEVDVREGDVQGVSVSLLPNVDVSGHVTFEHGVPTTKATSIQIKLSPEDTQDLMRGAYAHVNDDGSFTLHAAPDERYKIAAYGGPPEMYLKSATAGRDDVLEKGFSPATNRSLDLVFAPGAKLSGVIFGTDDKAEPGVTVLLAPEQRLNGVSVSNRFLAVTTDQNGRYQIQGLRPGSYWVYAFEHIEPGAYDNEEWLKGFAEQARTVRLSETGQETLDLKPIPAGAETQP
ncbi:MAG: hypothetical protein DMG60_02540 [Acidobacteria bacterium]|nr:MAG: hypothetical protein DMG60_02540 [Acidobacteriota bacterium]